MDPRDEILKTEMQVDNTPSEERKDSKPWVKEDFNIDEEDEPEHLTPMTNNTQAVYQWAQYQLTELLAIQ